MKNPKTLKTYTNLGKKTKKNKPIARSISNICSFEENGNEINDDTIIITISLFKLDSMYKDITVYLDGLTNIIIYVENTLMIMKKEIIHDLDYSEIDELDEISGDEQLCFIWCNTHEEHEWHWIARQQ